MLIGDDNTADLALDNPALHHKYCMHVIKEDKQSYQNSCQLNPYITKDEIMRKIILINIHNLWERNVYKTYF